MYSSSDRERKAWLVGIIRPLWRLAKNGHKLGLVLPSSAGVRSYIVHRDVSEYLVLISRPRTVTSRRSTACRRVFGREIKMFPEKKSGGTVAGSLGGVRPQSRTTRPSPPLYFHRVQCLCVIEMEG